MSNCGGFAVTQTQSSDRFYNPPAVRMHRQFLLQQPQQLQRQLHRAVKAERQVEYWTEADTRTDDSDESTLSRPSSACSSSAVGNANLTNLDRLMESITPFVSAQMFREERIRGWRNREVDTHSYFCLEDLWQSFSEWSVYGVGVPLLLNGGDSIKQYYVPSLSGIQLYIDPNNLWKHGEDDDVESSREASSDGPQNKLLNADSHWLNGLTLRDRPQKSSSSDESEVCNAPGMLAFEYMEREQPHYRLPFYDKVKYLASQYPELSMYRSCDLLPTSWVSVAWYPIYRIPVGPTLQNLDASFLTFHSLSTNTRSRIQESNANKKIHGIDASGKISVPVFGLASYKLRNSILTPNGAYESRQANSLLQAAENWLQDLHVNLPDFQFFLSHGSQ